jgi:hypothetical protein
MMIELGKENSNLSRVIQRNVFKPQRDCSIWCTVPILSEGPTENTALNSWKTWDSFRMSCDQHHRVSLALRLGEDVPLEYNRDFKRWEGEPIKAIIIPKGLFRLNKKGFPVLLKAHQDFILNFAHLDPYLIIEVNLNYKIYDECSTKFIFLILKLYDSSKNINYKKSAFLYIQKNVFHAKDTVAKIN